jgi:hypothetical protein
MKGIITISNYWRQELQPWEKSSFGKRAVITVRGTFTYDCHCTMSTNFPCVHHICLKCWSTFREIQANIYQIEVDGRSESRVVIDSNDDGTVSENRNNHVNYTKRNFHSGNETERWRPWTTATGVVEFAEIKLQDVGYGCGIFARRVKRRHDVQMFHFNLGRHSSKN